MIAAGNVRIVVRPLCILLFLRDLGLFLVLGLLVRCCG